MRIDRGLLNWGVFLIALGGVPLAVQQGWIDSSLTSDLWRLWPLILVGIGLGLILRWTPIAWLGGALVAGTFGLIFGALLGGGVSGISSACIGIGEEGETTTRDGVASGSAFSVELTLSCGELGLEREAGASWSVRAVHGSDVPPTIDATAERLRIDQRFEGDAFLVFTQETRNDWQVGVPAAAALTLDMTMNAGDAAVDLGAGPIMAVGGTFNASEGDLDLRDATAPTGAQLRLTYNASSGTIALPTAPLDGGITLNASSLTVCVPADADVRIRHDGTLSSADFGSSGLAQRGDAWVSPSPPPGAPTVTLDIESTVSSVTIEPMEGCG